MLERAQLRVALETLKRIVVIVAAVAALFPLLQWYFEKDDRELDRMVALAISGEACIGEGYTPKLFGWSNREVRTENKSDALAEIVSRQKAISMAGVCEEIWKAMHSEERVRHFQQFIDRVEEPAIPVDKLDFIEQQPPE